MQFYKLLDNHFARSVSTVKTWKWALPGDNEFSYWKLSTVSCRRRRHQTVAAIIHKRELLECRTWNFVFQKTRLLLTKQPRHAAVSFCSTLISLAAIIKLLVSVKWFLLFSCFCEWQLLQVKWYFRRAEDTTEKWWKIYSFQLQSMFLQI